MRRYRYVHCCRRQPQLISFQGGQAQRLAYLGLFFKTFQIEKGLTNVTQVGPVVSRMNTTRSACLRAQLLQQQPLPKHQQRLLLQRRHLP